MQKLIQSIGFFRKQSDFQRRLQTSLYQHIGNNTPVWNDDNLESYITKGYNRNHVIHSIVQWIARKAAQIDYKVIELKPGGETLELQDHPALEAVYHPNQGQGKAEFLEAVFGFLALTGNTYIYLGKPEAGPNKGKVQEMHALPAALVEIVRGSNFNPVGGYNLIYTDRTDTFEADEVLHMKFGSYYFNHGVELYGVSPLMAGWYLLQKSNANTEAAKKAFDNMGALGLLYEKDNWSAYTDAQRKAAQAQLDKKVRGTDNKGRIIYTGGEFGYINFGANPVDLALIEDAKMTVTDLCRLYHVDPRLFGSDSTFTNLKEARKISYVDGVLPLANMFAEEFTRCCLTAYGKNLKLVPVTDNIPELQADKKDQAQWLSQAYWLDENEKREAMGYSKEDKFEGVYHIPAGLIPYGAEIDLPDNVNL